MWGEDEQWNERAFVMHESEGYETCEDEGAGHQPNVDHQPERCGERVETAVMELPKRKHIRLPDYDYSQNGVYFVTICTAYRKPILSEIKDSVGRDDLGAPYVECCLLSFGKIVERYIRLISEAYPGVLVEKYCIMPNHIHILLRFQMDDTRRAGSSRPTQLLPRVVAALKRFSNRDAGEKLWQSGYYEHIIRDENDFLARWQYIDQNPARWTEDEYYGEER